MSFSSHWTQLLSLSFPGALTLVLSSALFCVRVVSGVLASLQVPIVLISDLAATLVVFDPPDKAFQAANKGAPNPDSAMVGGELRDCGADVRDVLQQHFSKIIKALKTSQVDSAQAIVPTSRHFFRVFFHSLQCLLIHRCCAHDSSWCLI